MNNFTCSRLIDPRVSLTYLPLVKGREFFYPRGGGTYYRLTSSLHTSLGHFTRLHSRGMCQKLPALRPAFYLHLGSYQ